MFECKRNPFLAQMLNMRKIKEETYYFNKDGKVILLTNIEVLHHFLQHAKPNQLKTIQNYLSQNKFSVKDINIFAKEYAKNYMLKTIKK